MPKNVPIPSTQDISDDPIEEDAATGEPIWEFEDPQVNEALKSLMTERKKVASSLFSSSSPLRSVLYSSDAEDGNAMLIPLSIPPPLTRPGGYDYQHYSFDSEQEEPDNSHSGSMALRVNDNTLQPLIPPEQTTPEITPSPNESFLKPKTLVSPRGRHSPFYISPTVSTHHGGGGGKLTGYVSTFRDALGAFGSAISREYALSPSHIPILPKMSPQQYDRFVASAEDTLGLGLGRQTSDEFVQVPTEKQAQVIMRDFVEPSGQDHEVGMTTLDFRSDDFARGDLGSDFVQFHYNN